jgi:hypothetical protein
VEDEEEKNNTEREEKDGRGSAHTGRGVTYYTLIEMI